MVFVEFETGVCGDGKETVFEFIPTWKCIACKGWHGTGKYTLSSDGLMIVYLDRAKRVDVIVAMGWNDIVSGEVIVTSLSGGLTFDFAEMSNEVSAFDNCMVLLSWLMEDGDRSPLDVDMTSSWIIGFGRVAQDSNIRFSIPFTSMNQNELDVSYCMSKLLRSVENRSKIHNFGGILYLFPFVYRRLSTSFICWSDRFLPSENVGPLSL
jgi:hypothetical protein